MSKITAARKRVPSPIHNQPSATAFLPSYRSGTCAWRLRTARIPEATRTMPSTMAIQSKYSIFISFLIGHFPCLHLSDKHGAKTAQPRSELPQMRSLTALTNLRKEARVSLVASSFCPSPRDYFGELESIFDLHWEFLHTCGAEGDNVRSICRNLAPDSRSALDDG